MSKYITNVYKIYTPEDELKIFIGSTPDYKKVLHKIKNKHFEEWCKNVDKSTLKVKLIKSYAVLNKEEEKQRKKYWITKYSNYGYSVINNKNEKNEDIVNVTLKGVSITQIVHIFGNKIISVSKDKVSPCNSPSSPSRSSSSTSLGSSSHSCSSSSSSSPSGSTSIHIPKSNAFQENSNYVDELKNILSLRNSNKNMSDITNKKISEIKKIPIENNFLDELKNTLSKRKK